MQSFVRVLEREHFEIQKSKCTNARSDPLKITTYRWADENGPNRQNSVTCMRETLWDKKNVSLEWYWCGYIRDKMNECKRNLESFKTFSADDTHMLLIRDEMIRAYRTLKINEATLGFLCKSSAFADGQPLSNCKISIELNEREPDRCD